MSLSAVRKIYEKRYVEMAELLHNPKKDLSPERQHQLYGAVIEIQSFLETVKKFEDESKTDEIGTFLDVKNSCAKTEGYWSSSEDTQRGWFGWFLEPFKKKR